MIEALSTFRRGVRINLDTEPARKRDRVYGRDIHPMLGRIPRCQPRDLPQRHPYRLHAHDRHCDVRARYRNRDHEIVDASGKHRSVRNLPWLSGSEGFARIPEHTFHEPIHGETAVVTRMHIERMLTDGHWLIHFGRSTGRRVHGEVMLRYDRAALDAASLPHINLPRPVSRILKFFPVQTERSHVLADGCGHARIVLQKPDEAGHMIDMEFMQPCAVVSCGFRPCPTRPGDINACERFDIAVHLVFAASQTRTPTPVLQAPGSEVLEERNVIDEMQVIR